MPAITPLSRVKMSASLIGNQNRLTHGMYGTRTYESWHSMKQRTGNSNRTRYKDYGGRGITVCIEWLAFEGFYADMGERPEGMSLDRINNDGPWPKSNVLNRRGI